MDTKRRLRGVVRLGISLGNYYRHLICVNEFEQQDVMSHSRSVFAAWPVLIFPDVSSKEVNHLEAQISLGNPQPKEWAYD